MINVGDIVKITMGTIFSSSEVSGIVVSISPVMPHLEPHTPFQPGPIYDVKLLTSEGMIWSSMIDQTDKIEILRKV